MFGTIDDVIGSPGVRRADASGEYYEDPMFGFDPQVTRRSAQVIMGGLWSPEMFWDGRAAPQFINPETGLVSLPTNAALETQAVQPIVSAVEMAHEGRTWSQVTAKLQSVDPLALAVNLPPDVAAALAVDATYPALFEAAFGDAAITAERIAFAIATYERTLLPDETPWDAFIHQTDPNALTPDQQAGWQFYIGSACADCHQPPLFTDNSFRNIGLRPIEEDAGRFEVTAQAADRGRFKVPSLRNVGLKSTFMHNGRLSSLDEVLDFYEGINGQVQFPDNQDPLIATISIPSAVRPQLIDFIANGLTDPRIAAEQFPFDRPTLRSELTPGDIDGDGDVDLADFAVFGQCFGGSNQPPAGACPSPLIADLDADGDVDLSDFATFAQNFTGAH
jgi:cytochrome c peroxidase